MVDTNISVKAKTSTTIKALINLTLLRFWGSATKTDRLFKKVELTW